MTAVSVCADEPRVDGWFDVHCAIHDSASDERLAPARRCTNVFAPACFVAELAEERVPEAARECSHEGS